MLDEESWNERHETDIVLNELWNEADKNKNKIIHKWYESMENVGNDKQTEETNGQDNEAERKDPSPEEAEHLHAENEGKCQARAQDTACVALPRICS